MQVQTEIPISALEMFIRDNVSGNPDDVNETTSMHMNGTYAHKGGSPGAEFESSNQLSMQTVRGVCLIIFFVVGGAFNSFMIVSIVPNRRLRTVRNMLLVHLGCTGLVFSVLINLVTAVVSFTGKWFGGVILCQFYGFIMSVLTLVTSWTIAALSWDKYQTIACPLHHSFTATAVKMFVCFSVFWTMACTLSTPPMLGGSRFIFQPDKGVCFVCTNTIIGKVYIFFYFLAAVYIPLGIMLYCYTHIYKIARTQSSRIAATMVRMTCLIQAPIAPNSQAGSNLSIKGTKALCTIFQLVGAFVIVYVPLSVIFLIEIIAGSSFHVNSRVASVFATLFLSSPVVNSLVYGLRNKILRASFHRYLRRKIRYHCYKDKRKNSVKSFRSASFKAAMLHRRNNHQNGSGPGLRRTQSFPARGLRGLPRNSPTQKEKTNGGPCLLAPDPTLTRPHSFNVLNTSPARSPSPVDENDEDELKDIPHIDDDDIC